MSKRLTPRLLTAAALIAVLFAFRLPAANIQAAGATINVTTATDEFDVSGNGACSLREAIKSANQNADFGGCSHSGTYGVGDIIQLPASTTYNLTITGPGENADATGDLDITEGVIIQGSTNNTIDASSLSDRAFHIFSTIAGQSTTISNVTINGGTVNGDGAAIYNGDVTLFPMTLALSNVTINGSGGEAFGEGGGIWNSGALTLTSSSISGATACEDGGGIYNTTMNGTTAGSLTMTDSHVDENTAGECDTDGGGIYNEGGAVSITGGSVNGNFATGSGGGIYSLGGSVTLSGTEVNGNEAAGFDLVDVGIGGGGIYFAGGLAVATTGLSITSTDIGRNQFGEFPQDLGTLAAKHKFKPSAVRPLISGGNAGGGGIYVRSSTVTVSLSHIEANTVIIPTGPSMAGVGGGGIYDGGSPGSNLSITTTTIAENTVYDGDGGGIYVGDSDTLTLTQSTVGPTNDLILVNNSAANGGGIYAGGVINVTNSTITTNHAATASQGGGIYFTGNHTSTVQLSTLNLNQASIGSQIAFGGAVTTQVNLFADILAGGNTDNCETTTGINDFGANVFDDDSCGGIASDKLGDPNLQDLHTSNGSPTKTHALVAGSIAIDVVPSSGTHFCPAEGTNIDQRGQPRPIDGDNVPGALCDAGAYEFQPPPVATATPTPTRTPTVTPTGVVSVGTTTPTATPTATPTPFLTATPFPTATPIIVRQPVGSGVLGGVIGGIANRTPVVAPAVVAPVVPVAPVVILPPNTGDGGLLR